MSNTALVPIPSHINRNVSAARQQTMLAVLGNPRAVYSSECQNPTAPQISELIVHEQVGCLKVRGLRPAVESLRQVLGKIEQAHPDVYSALGHAGMLCARFVRNSTTAVSNHSWGTAIDLTLDGVLDIRGDGRVQQGLVKIAPIFNDGGWFWGAGFRTEDAMHFECSDDLVRSWAVDGKLGNPARAAAATASLLSLGDRGPDVAKVQTALNRNGSQLLVDGEFGRNTLAAVMAFQASRHLVADGVVGEKTLAALFS
ncbi:peptidoglycan-binding protein [Cupriavidus necator]|uniref:peptidoglycan-binding protein n=1 Tax=Cupriavidus necator TaxID=106590 RepID=UPI0039C0776C